MDSPFFSIIIPTLNSEGLIRRCIESVLNQTYSNFEILVMDGLSQDRTLEIVKKYQDSRVRIFDGKDEGVYDAMNKAIALSKGTWLYFLGSDDALYSNETLNSIFLECVAGVDVIYGNVFNRRFKNPYDGKFDETKILKRNICHQAIFLRRSIFNKIGNFDLKYTVHADWDHSMRWLLSSDIKHRYIDLVIADFAEGGLSSNSSDLFKSERGLKYLMYAGSLLPASQLFFLSLKELKKSLTKGNFYVFFRILQNIPRIISGRPMPGGFK